MERTLSYIRTGLVFKAGKGNLAIDTVYSVDKPILFGLRRRRPDDG